jgi:hypothetical protein
MKKTLASILIFSFFLLLNQNIAYAGVSHDTTGCGCYCGKVIPPPCSDDACKQACGWSGSAGGSSSGSGYNRYQAAYQLGYAFGQWLSGSGSNQQAELQRQQQQQMMEELRRRQAEAERQHREEEARRLAAIYNRLLAKLKLSGLPNLQMKDLENKGTGLNLKLGDNATGQAGIKGLPGIYLNDGKTPYGIPGLPGIYTSSPGQGSGLTDSNRAMKTGDSSTMPNAQDAFDPSKMTPQQLADVAELFSELPPEEQERLLNMAQNNAHTGQASTVTINSSSMETLQNQADASQSAAATPGLEDASMRARAGFDQPLGPSPVQLGVSAGNSNIIANNNSKVVDAKDVKSETQKLGTQPMVNNAATTVSPVTSSRKSDVEEFLFPSKEIFHKNPDKPLLNPLIELPKGESLPQKGETADEFCGRLEKTELGREITCEKELEWLFSPEANGPTYHRGHNPVTDKILNDAFEQMDERETRRIHNACKRAVADMNAAWANMEKQGIIRPGENIKEKEKTDVIYEQAIMPVRNRIYEQLEKDIRDAKYKSQYDLSILKLFIKQIKTATFLGGPSDIDIKNPEQMKRLLNDLMIRYSGYSNTE